MVLNLPTACCSRPMAALCCSGDDRFFAGEPTRSWVTLEGINQAPCSSTHPALWSARLWSALLRVCHNFALWVSIWRLRLADMMHISEVNVFGRHFDLEFLVLNWVFLYCSSTMCGSQHLSASFYMWLQVWFGVLNVPNVFFDTRNVIKMP